MVEAMFMHQPAAPSAAATISVARSSHERLDLGPAVAGGHEEAAQPGVAQGEDEALGEAAGGLRLAGELLASGATASAAAMGSPAVVTCSSGRGIAGW